MTKNKHPQNKQQRKLLEKRHDEKATKADKAGRIRKRLNKESYEIKEKEDELAELGIDHLPR